MSRLTGDSAIRASGESALAETDSEGGAGGSGGGTAVLSVVDASGFTGSIRADGGDGGDAASPGFAVGPGGGGGGGFVKVLLGDILPASLSVAGGVNGTTEGASAHDAAPGGDGIAESP